MLWPKLAVVTVIAILHFAEPKVFQSEEDIASLSEKHVYRFKRDLTTNCDPDDEVPPNRVNTTARLADLREVMIQNDLDAYIIPLDEEGRRTWISGFSGSNGDAIVTKDRALCWTDGRYFLQASSQLDCNWELMKMGLPETPTYTSFLANNLTSGSTVGADPTLIGAKTWIDMKESLAKKDVKLVSIRANLIDQIWTSENDRPEFTPKTVVPHAIEYAGQVWPEKVKQLRNTLSNSDLYAMVISEQDEIAWLFNLRGEGNSTLEGLFHSPLFQSLALISQNESYLWIHTSSAVPGLMAHLTPPNCEEENVCTVVGEFEKSIEELKSWAAVNKNQSVLVTKSSTYLTGASYAVYEAIPSDQVKFKDSPVMLAKNVKNEVEAEGMMKSHIRDAVALCQFAAHMEDEIENQQSEKWTEISAADLLAEYRSKQALNKGISFTTISAFGSNGAIIHYSPTPETNAKIDNSSLFLVDSGGQYFDGTTDVTRTFHYGKPSQEQIDAYTMVLKAAIDLARIKMPNNTNAKTLDIITRQPFFEKGQNFRHGTGHGIGAYLKVHEGPTYIGLFTGTCSPIPGNMVPRVFFSDEPGFYLDGKFGVRLETILTVVEMESEEETPFGNFVEFAPVTLVPFEPKLIDFSQLSVKQIEWYNSYNEVVKEKVLPKLEDLGDIRAYNWASSRLKYVSPSQSNDVQKWRSEL